MDHHVRALSPPDARGEQRQPPGQQKRARDFSRCIFMSSHASKHISHARALSHAATFFFSSPLYSLFLSAPRLFINTYRRLRAARGKWRRLNALQSERVSVSQSAVTRSSWPQRIECCSKGCRVCALFICQGCSRGKLPSWCCTFIAGARLFLASATPVYCE